MGSRDKIEQEETAPMKFNKIARKIEKDWLWGVRFNDGTYLHLEGNTIEEAVQGASSSMAEVRRYLPLKSRAVQEKKQASLDKFLEARLEKLEPAEAEENEPTERDEKKAEVKPSKRSRETLSRILKKDV